MSRQEVWVREKLLGHGGYGMVWLERMAKGSQTTPEFRAVKQIRVQKPITDGDLYIRELEALAKFSQDKAGGLCRPSNIYYVNSNVLQ